MRPITRTALAALLAISFATQGVAQEQVRVFEDAPSIEELRAILIPESTPGKTRRIELPHSGAPAATQGAASVTPEAPPAPPSIRAVERGEVTASPPAEKPGIIRTTAAAVAFHINFASNSDAIPPSYRAHLDRMVDFMREQPELTLTIEGHTDAYGSVEYNLNLSRRRAVSVMRYLVDHGIDAGRLVAVGKGKSSPMTSDPFDGRNRRVQFVNTGAQSHT